MWGEYNDPFGLAEKDKQLKIELDRLKAEVIYWKDAYFNMRDLAATHGTLNSKKPIPN